MIPCFVTVRTGSSRLLKKCLLPLSGATVLHHVIFRVRYHKFLRPIICTTMLPEDDIIEKIADAEMVEIYRGSAEDKLQRWLGACDKFNIKKFYTVDADDPFFDGDLVRKSMKLLKGNDIVYPPENAYIGAGGYSLTADIVRRACEIKQSTDTEMMWYYIKKVPGVKEVNLKTYASPPKMRLTLDYPEDYTVIAIINGAYGLYASRKDIEWFFTTYPKLAEMNWFRNEEWKKAQEAKAI